MPAGEEFAAAQLQDLKHPGFPLGDALGAQRDDGIGDGEFGRVVRVVSTYSATRNR